MTTAELIAELESLLPKREGDPACFTTRTLAEHKGWSEYRARNVARELTKLGLVSAEMVTIVNDWGQSQSVKGFRIVGR